MGQSRRWQALLREATHVREIVRFLHLVWRKLFFSEIKVRVKYHPPRCNLRPEQRLRPTGHQGPNSHLEVLGQAGDILELLGSLGLYAGEFCVMRAMGERLPVTESWGTDET